MRNIIITESLDKNQEYYMDSGTWVRQTPPTYMDLLVRSKFTSNIRWHVIFLNCIGNLLLSSRNLKTALTFFIFFLVESCQYVLPFILSSSIAL